MHKCNLDEFFSLGFCKAAHALKTDSSLSKFLFWWNCFRSHQLLDPHNEKTTEANILGFHWGGKRRPTYFPWAVILLSMTFFRACIHLPFCGLWFQISGKSRPRPSGCSTPLRDNKEKLMYESVFMVKQAFLIQNLQPCWLKAGVIELWGWKINLKWTIWVQCCLEDFNVISHFQWTMDLSDVNTNLVFLRLIHVCLFSSLCRLHTLSG